MSRSLGIPVKLLHEAAGHIVTVELKSGEVYRGSMIECEDNWNCQLENITFTAKDGKVAQLEHVFIRGSKVRFMIIPDMLKNAPMFKRLEARIKGKGSALGVGRGRAVAMRARAQAAGRGAAGPGRGRPSQIQFNCLIYLICFQLFDLLQQRPSSAYNTPFWTTNAGAPVYNNTASLTVGNRGPILLEDYHLIEKLANFTRERIPERIVHARGASAKGFFEVTHDITHLTCADFLRAPGVQTPVIVRFSTVIHERGSPETIRDPRGFATKFYTREGNFDIVGNNFPVFFTRDAMAFPDVIHAFKPNPKSHIQEDWRILDFLSHHPESLNTMTFWLDDIGIPTDYRHMEGSSVNTLTLVNKDGKMHYVKFTWKPTCGVKCLMDDEAIKIGGANHSHATQDLYDSIQAGKFPEWKLFLQVIDPDHEDRLDFDPLDGTMTWPDDIIPLQPVGRMVLNKNIDNFFAENEQLAFNPGLVVPGIYYSDDKMLQGRIFAYSDTQRHRLGPNYLQLPVNAPKCAHHNNHYDGHMNFMHRDEEVDYFPSRYDRVQHAQKYPINPARVTGTRDRTVIPKYNDFKQPGERYRSWDPARQERFIVRMVKMLSDPRVTHELRSIWISYWTQADQSLGQKIASRLNVRPNY
ncbi:hypothetical protein SSX86_020571 [Deinandra increscens subsp. villosa]